jgi:hypothetical protein
MSCLTSVQPCTTRVCPFFPLSLVPWAIPCHVPPSSIEQCFHEREDVRVLASTVVRRCTESGCAGEQGCHAQQGSCLRSVRAGGEHHGQPSSATLLRLRAPAIGASARLAHALNALQLRVERS